MTKSPEEAWNGLVRNKAEIVSAYGANSRLVEEFLGAIDHLSIKQWIFPIVSMGSVVLSRFEPYSDRLAGPVVRIALNNEVYKIEYMFDGHRKPETDLTELFSSIDFEKIAVWLEQKV